MFVLDESYRRLLSVWFRSFLMYQQHIMILEKTHPSGADEWVCPICGRRLLLDYEPTIKKTVLETGDAYAIHSGGKGGLQTGSLPPMPIEKPILEESRALLEDSSLAPWVAWMDEINFENLWHDEI
jgi:hypothetical protein